VEPDGQEGEKQNCQGGKENNVRTPKYKVLGGHAEEAYVGAEGTGLSLAANPAEVEEQGSRNSHERRDLGKQLDK
jgi:hypothetical protein